MTGPENDTDSTTASLRELAEVEERALPGRRSRVTLAGGESFVVRISNREYIAWDMTAHRRGWGTLQEAPFVAATFMSWKAAQREGKTGLTWDQWQDQVEACENLQEEPEDIARPTR